MEIIDVIDIGDEVVCDYCNAGFDKESTTLGGVLVGSYAVCPECAVKVKKPDLKCPDSMTFRDWVLSLRKGDNTIKIYG